MTEPFAVGQPLVEVRTASARFAMRGTMAFWRRPDSFVAIDRATFDITQGETLGCVGETGSGKSTLGRMILNLVPVSGGEIRFDGRRIDSLGPEQARPLRREMQIVFQDSLQAMNPRRTVAQNMIQPLLNFGTPRAEALGRMAEMLALVGLDAAQADRYPHEFSGGQCQRMGIARALMLRPRFIFLDEPVSALDVSIQAQIVNLLLEIKRRFDLTYLFVSHDLAIVRYVSDRIIVLYHGRIVEVGNSDEVHAAPIHPYTQALSAAALTGESADGWLDVARTTGTLIDGDRPERAIRAASGNGCIYARSCPHCWQRCEQEVPALRQVGPGRFVACHLADGASSEMPCAPVN
jgi:oligopeptide/dipeptide ABC transporter ATP-binding protein